MSIRERMHTQRCQMLERVGEIQGRFRCPKGHEFVVDLIPKRKRKLGNIGEPSYRMIASWWMKTGVITQCPKCEKERRSCSSN